MIYFEIIRKSQGLQRHWGNNNFMPNLCESVSKLCISGRYIYIVQPAAWCPGSYLQHTYLLENKYYIVKWNIWCLQFCKMIDRICITTCQTYNTKKIEFIEQLLTLWISHCISFDVCTYYYVEEIKLLYRVNQIPSDCCLSCLMPLAKYLSWKQFTVISFARMISDLLPDLSNEPLISESALG